MKCFLFPVLSFVLLFISDITSRNYFNYYELSGYSLVFSDRFGMEVKYKIRSIPEPLLDTCIILMESQESFLIVIKPGHKKQIMKQDVIFIEWRSLFVDNSPLEIPNYSDMDSLFMYEKE